jgi:hypothetical protein
MRTLIVLSALMSVALGAYATDWQMRAPIPVAVTPPAGVYYCQPPNPYLWSIYSGSAPQVFDDIPDSLSGFYATGIVFYVGVWGGSPSGNPYFCVDFAHMGAQDCPPDFCLGGATPGVSLGMFYWSSVPKELIYDDPGVFAVYRLRVDFSGPVPITSDMWVGIRIFGMGSAYYGVVMTGDNVLYGCEAYWVNIWTPSWSTIYQNFGTHGDFAYCLVGTPDNATVDVIDCCIPAGESAVSYRFSITAGACPIDSVEFQLYLYHEVPIPPPPDVLACSVPLANWACSVVPYNPAEFFRRIRYMTETPILPHTTCGPFGFSIPAAWAPTSLCIAAKLSCHGVLVGQPAISFPGCWASDVEPTTWGAVKAMYR